MKSIALGATTAMVYHDLYIFHVSNPKNGNFSFRMYLRFSSFLPKQHAHRDIIVLFWPSMLLQVLFLYTLLLLAPYIMIPTFFHGPILMNIADLPLLVPGSSSIHLHLVQDFVFAV